MRSLIDPNDPCISVTEQCDLLGLPRSSYYYHPQAESEENLLLMELLDKQYLRTPFYGVRKMRCHLQEEGYQVNPKRVRRLLRKMGIEAIYPRPRTSLPGKGGPNRDIGYKQTGHMVYTLGYHFDFVFDLRDRSWTTEAGGWSRPGVVAASCSSPINLVEK